MMRLPLSVPTAHVLPSCTLRNLLLALFAVLMSGIVASVPVRAQSQPDISGIIAKFGNDSYSDTTDAVTALATSGSPQAAAVVEALAAGNLLYDPATKAVFIRTSGGMVDPSTGAIDGTAPANH